ncbi:MAG: DUF349 domain-containing protein [Bacteroidales bacterium]|nr:DUF349 domain-containing protein [Candidatus Colimorpha onthohippi]
MEESILTSAANNEQPQQISQDANTNPNATLNQVAEQEQQSGETEAASADVKAVESPEVEAEFVEPDVDYKGMSREQLIETMRGLLDCEVQTIKHRVSGLRQCFNDLTKEIENEAYEAYLEAGGDKATYQRVEDSLSMEFRKLYETYRSRRQQYLDAIEERKKRNLDAKRQTLEELRQLLESNEEIKVIYDRFNEIQDRWKAIGDVPREELNDLWQNYHFLVEQFFAKVNMAKELRMLDLKRNLEQKIQLCEKAESLILEDSLNKAFKEVQQLREQWREIGPVPSQNNEEIWSRFCNALDQVETRRREYYEQRKAEMDKNLLAKQALLEQVETLTATMPDTIKSWNSVSDELNKLLDLWKSIGAVPHEINEEFWGKFKGRIDQFYVAEKAFLNQMHWFRKAFLAT